MVVIKLVIDILLSIKPKFLIVPLFLANIAKYSWLSYKDSLVLFMINIFKFDISYPLPSKVPVNVLVVLLLSHPIG